MKKRFFIIGEQRSGTIALGDALCSHPEISVFGELFLNFPSADNLNSYFEFVAVKSKRGVERFYPHFDYIRNNLNDLFDYLESIDSSPIYGFHLKYDQVTYVVEIMKHLNELGFFCIHVIRPRVLDTLLSQIALASRHSQGLPSHTAVNSAEDMDLIVELPDISVLEKRALDIEARVNKNRSFLRNYFIGNYMEVTYPDFLAHDGHGGYANILMALGARDNNKLISTIKKSSSSCNLIYSNKDVISDPRLTSIVIDV